MSECEFITARLDDWLDGTLDGASRVRFEAHIAACERCAGVVARERQLAADLAGLNDIGNRIALEAAGMPLPKRKKTGGLRVAAAIAILFAGGYAATLLWRPSQTGPAAQEAKVAQGGKPAEPPVTTTFMLASGDARLSVRMPSDDPKVHVFWLYETASPPAGNDAANNEIEPGHAEPAPNRS